MAFLRESVGSLRAYFIVVGVVSVLYGFLAVAAASGGPIGLIEGLSLIAFGAVLIYAGTALPRLIDTGSTLVRNILYLWIAMAVLDALARVVMGSPAEGIASLLLRTVIALYLLRNVNRLMVERGARGPDTAQDGTPRARPYARPPWEKPPVDVPAAPVLRTKGETKLCAGYKQQIPFDATHCPICGAR